MLPMALQAARTIEQRLVDAGTITEQALTVVNNQAIAARDAVSGVNLDTEAASLIKYQQAYQAAAKAMQIAGQLFDTIVQMPG